MPSPKSPRKTPLSARADTPAPRSKPKVDLSLVDARLDELFQLPGQNDNSAEEFADGLASVETAISKTEIQKKPSSPSEESEVFRMLAHSQITRRPQVRQTFPEAEMEELRASIREMREQNGGIEGSGILQALLVTPDLVTPGLVTPGLVTPGLATPENEGFRLVAGERRFRASQSENIPLLPCLIIDAGSESTIRLLQLTENSSRTNPPILEESQAIKEAMEADKLSLRHMARLLGKDKSYVEVRVNLLKYPADVQEMVSARADTMRHARHLAGITDTRLRGQLIEAVREEGIGEREVKRRIKELVENKPDQKAAMEAASTKKANEKAVLAGAVKATQSAISKIREMGAAKLSPEEWQKEREARNAIQQLILELDVILDTAE